MELKYREVWAKAPASIANLGPGFDRVAISYDQFWDIVGVRPSNTLCTVLDEGSSLGGAPNDGAKNIAAVAADMVLRRIDPEGKLGNLKVTLHKGVPPASGLGSSAASAVAAVIATSVLFEGYHDLSKEELLAIAGEAESVASGEPHYDNVGASFHGGFVSVGKVVEVKLHSVKLVSAKVMHELPAWGIAVVTPRKILKSSTHEARECLPNDCDGFWFKVGMNSIRSIANFCNALQDKDIKRFANVVNSEYLITPYRLELYGKEKYEKAISEAKRVAEVGEWEVAVGLSGSGPSLFAIAESGIKAFTAGLAMKTVLGEADLYLSEMNDEGAQVVATRKGIKK